MTKDITRVVVESFDVVKKWLKKKLMRTIPRYYIAETNEELEVLKLSFLKFPFLALSILHH